MSALAWLNDLMVWFARWVPRLTLIKKGFEGALFGPGGRVTRKHAGLCLYWPILFDLQVVSTRERTMELAAQLHQGEAIALVVRYRVADVVLTVTTLNDACAYLDDRIQAALGFAYVSGLSNEKLCADTLQRLTDEMPPKGIQVFSVDIAQRSQAFVLKTLKDYAQHEGGEL